MDTSKLFYFYSLSADIGVLIAADKFIFLQRFYYALRNAATYGEFNALLGDSGCTYLSQFLGVDSNEMTPCTTDKICDLIGELWIFHDSEFPCLQAIEESSTENISIFPEHLIDSYIDTEYGVSIPLFSALDHDKIRDEMKTRGCELKLAPEYFGCHIYVSN